MTIAAIAIVILAALIGYVTTRPETIFIERSAVIGAPQAAVFALIEDLRNWPVWSPQDRQDPTLVRQYGGIARGLGATSDWASAGRGGAGRMTIIGLDPPNEIVVTVRFQRPFKAHNVNTFRLEAAEEGKTRVTWSMRGTNVLLLRLLALFGGADRALGRHFEAGLANLKAAAEQRPS